MFPKPLLHPDAGWSGPLLRAAFPVASQVYNILVATTLPCSTEFHFTEYCSLHAHCLAQSRILLCHLNTAPPTPRPGSVREPRDRKPWNHTLPTELRILIPSNTNPWSIDQLFGQFHLHSFSFPRDSSIFPAHRPLEVQPYWPLDNLDMSTTNRKHSLSL